MENGWLEAMRVGEALADLKERPTPQRRQHLQKALAQAGHGSEAELRDFLSRAVKRALDLATLFNVPVPDSQALTQLARELVVKASQLPAGLEPELSSDETELEADVTISDPQSDLDCLEMIMSQGG